MSTYRPLLALGALAALAGVTIVLLRTLFFGKMGEAAERAQKELPLDKIVWQTKASNFVGQQSQGPAAVHGNAFLAVTRDEIYSLMWIPRRELRIPLRNVTGVELVRSFMGRSRGQRMVKVTFRSEAGGQDSAAWAVADPEALRDLISRLSGLPIPH